MNFQRIMLGWSMGRKPIPKGYTLYYFIYIVFLNDKIIEVENRLVVLSQGLGGGSRGEK
jgi:hypothetical protein